MTRRIISRILLAGFAAMLINLIFIRYQWQLFLWVYLAVVMIYILFFNRKEKC
ncbi:MAG: hypothetical protein PHG48_02075 [Eubacteriales bacterium]|nr:hypothetical protein [Eubacteriales bacterium]